MSGDKLEAYVTLATSDSYAIGALVLASSLRSFGTTRRLVCMAPSPSAPVGISEHIRSALGKVFDEVVAVNLLDSCDASNLALLQRPDLGVTFTKLNCWNLTQYSKCVFLDADTLVLQNCDDLFEREELSAAPDPGWPDCFNSGVFVYSPSHDMYARLLNFAKTHGSFDGGDQGLLNAFFSDWATRDIARHLPFVYNASWQSYYTYQPALQRFKAHVRICHFIGARKPWHQMADVQSGRVIPQQGWTGDVGFLQTWWDVLRKHVLPLLDTRNSGLLTEDLSPQIMGLLLHQPSLQPQPTIVYAQNLTADEHLARWEQGSVDYTGIDRFENIQKVLDKKISEPGTPDTASVFAGATNSTSTEVPTIEVSDSDITKQNRIAGDGGPTTEDPQ